MGCLIPIILLAFVIYWVFCFVRGVIIGHMESDDR